MNNYFKDFFPTLEILQKSNRVVLLAQSNLYHENCSFPKEFIIKFFKSDSIPLEITLQTELCQKSKNILSVYDHWNQDELFYMAMEYCPRGDLHKYLIFLNGTYLGWSNVLQKCYEVCYTVNIIHSSGYAHRDIKPLNIYITNDFEFKLADFGEAKYIGSDNGEVDYHTIRGTPYYMSPEVKSRHDRIELLKNNPFRDDIWGLALTFIEIAMGRLCPEVSQMNSDQRWGFLANNFQCFGYSEKFIKMISCMMPNDLQSQFYTANQILRIILELINEHNNVKPMMAEEPKIVNEIAGVEESNNIKEVSTKEIDNLKKVNVEIVINEPTTEDDPVSEVEGIQMPLISPETFRVPKLPPKPVLEKDLGKNKNIVFENDDEYDSSDHDSSDHDNSDHESDSDSIDLGEYEKQIMNKNKEIEEDKSNSFYQGRDNEKVFTEFNNAKSERENPTYAITEKFKLEHSHSNQIASVYTDIIERSDSRIPNESVPGRDSAKINNVQVLFESVRILPPLSQTTPPPIILPSIPIGNCSKCDGKISEVFVKLDCPHFFHRECFKNQYEEKILKAKKISDIACIKCSQLVNIESLSNMHFLEKKALIRANVLNFSTVEVSCPNCSMPLKEKMVNPKNLKPEDAKCKKCQSKICSFCSVIGGHRFFCDLFRDYSKGESSFDHYLKLHKNK